jgi:hypothetical protein
VPIHGTIISWGNTMTVYEACTDAHGDDALLIVQCVAEWVEMARNSTGDGNNAISKQYVSIAELTEWLLVLTGALVFFMQAGFAMVCAGAIRKKNINNTVSICERIVRMLRMSNELRSLRRYKSQLTICLSLHIFSPKDA